MDDAKLNAEVDSLSGYLLTRKLSYVETNMVIGAMFVTAGQVLICLNKERVIEGLNNGKKT